MSKPYVQVIRDTAEFPFAVEQVWAHHCDIESLLAAHPRLHTMTLEAGAMGEVGCVTRATGVDLKGRHHEVANEVIEAQPPVRAVVKSMTLGDMGSHVITDNTFVPTETGCRLERTTTLATVPMAAPLRWLVGLGASGRRRASQASVQREVEEIVTHLMAKGNTA